MRKAKQTYHAFSVRLHIIQKKKGMDFEEGGEMRAKKMKSNESQ